MEIEVLESLKNIDGVKESIIKGYFDNNIISYTLDEITMHIDITKHIMIRESDTDKYTFDFEDKKLTCILKDHNLDMSIGIVVLNLFMDENTIDIKYYLDIDDKNIIEYKLVVKGKK